MSQGGGSFDPLVLSPADANQNILTVTLRSQTINAAVKNLVLIVAGQSNIANVAPSAYVPTNAAAIDVLNVYNQAIYAAVDPLIGCSNVLSGVGNPMLRVADGLITGGYFDRVILVPIAVSATSVAQWDTGGVSDRFEVAMRRLAARGVAQGTNVTFAAVWGQGESDTVLSTSQAAYAASLNSIISKSRAAGFTGRWFIGKQTYHVGTTSAAVQAAQAAVVDHGAGVYAGPDADALVGTACGGNACRQGDNLHWSNAGSASYAAAWLTALHASGAPF